ncbi:hypothetical protein B0T12DRAFT_262445 [Alternaria alternata]|nr:hypothetical protein B0T12DRAFT_262445 [Alternaria alternata]
MAGRILPVALATIVGVSIGVATFDGEFKKQRIARLEAEYKRYAGSTCAFSCFHLHSYQGTRCCCRFHKYSNSATSSPGWQSFHTATD